MAKVRDPLVFLYPRICLDQPAQSRSHFRAPRIFSYRMPGFGQDSAQFPGYRCCGPNQLSFSLPGAKRGIAMNKLARALLSVLLLAAVGLTAGCGGISSDKLNTDQFWEKLAREGN
jgi:hypothetical protein